MILVGPFQGSVFYDLEISILISEISILNTENQYSECWDQYSMIWK